MIESFSQKVKTIKGVFRFTFSKIEVPSHGKYFVRAEVGTFQVAMFDMKQNKKGRWEVVEPAPKYIIQAGPILSAILEENVTA